MKFNELPYYFSTKFDEEPTKSAFLCFFALRNPRFRAFRAQNRHFCALFAFGTPIFRHFEHKIEVFVRFWPSGPPFSGFSSTKSAFLCFFTLRNPRFRSFRAQNRGFCARADGGTASVRVHWRVSIRKSGDNYRLGISGRQICDFCCYFRQLAEKRLKIYSAVSAEGWTVSSA